MEQRRPAQGSKPKLVSGTAIYLLSNSLNAAIPFLLLPVLARVLGPQQYGQVGLFQMAVSVLAAFTGLCVHTAASRKYYDSPTHDDLAAFIGTCFRILAVSSAFIFVVACIVSRPLSITLGMRSEWLLAAVATSTCGVIINLRLGQWQVRGSAVRYGRFQVMQGLALMLLALLLVVGFGAGAAGRIMAQLFVMICFALLAYRSLGQDKLISFERRPDLAREALAYGLPLVPHIAGVFLLGTIDRAVINHTYGLGQVGIYVVAVQLAMPMAMVFDAINKAYVPWLFLRLGLNNPVQNRRIVLLTYLHFACALAAAGALAFVGPPLVTLFAGPGYEGAAAAIGWLALGQAFSGMYLMVTNYVFYSRRTWLLSLVTVAAGAVNIALLLWLVPMWGPTGAGIAFTAAMAVRFAITWGIAQTQHPMPWLSLLRRTPADSRA